MRHASHAPARLVSLSKRFQIFDRFDFILLRVRLLQGALQSMIYRFSIINVDFLNNKKTWKISLFIGRIQFGWLASQVKNIWGMGIT